MSYIPLNRTDLTVGQAIPWRVFDAQGRLLLNEGFVFASDDQIDAFQSRRAFRESTESELNGTRSKGNSNMLDPFSRLQSATQTLAVGLASLAGGDSRRVDEWVNPLVNEVMTLGRMYTDAVLGALLLMDTLPYSLAHTWMCATLCDVLGKRTEMTEDTRRSLIAAALTANAGMYELQDAFADQAAPLTDEQRKAVHQHPARSAQLLAKAGVTDQVWLQTALLHHERLDGSGYPRKIAGDGIPVYARMLALADIYSAMLLPRSYRDGVHARQALREIFTQRGGQIDADLAALFIKEIGVFPPGIFVKLEGGETAVVIRRNPKHANKPIVSSLRNPIGRVFERPVIRDTASAKVYGVAEVLPRQELTHPLQTVWGNAF